MATLHKRIRRLKAAAAERQELVSGSGKLGLILARFTEAEYDVLVVALKLRAVEGDLDEAQQALLQRWDRLGGPDAARQLGSEISGDGESSELPGKARYVIIMQAVADAWNSEDTGGDG